MNDKKYLSNLTPLRGIAALLTVIFHVNIVLSSFGGQLLDGKSSSILNRMYLMVDFFFILSGFILCYVYARNFDERVRWQGFKKLAIARFARIYPLHLFSLLLTTLFLFLLHRYGAKVSPILDAENSAYSFITNLFLLHSMNLHRWFTFTHASWSISTEWWMYMLFPFLVGPFVRLSKTGRLIIFSFCVVGYLVIGGILVTLVTLPEPLSFLRVQAFSLNVAYQFGFFRCMVGFILGMLVYLEYKEGWGEKIFSHAYTFLLLCFGLVLCMHFAVPDVITVLFFPGILLAAAYGNPNIDIIFASTPLQRLGDWSFSIYLLHQPFLYQGAALLLNPDKTGIPIPKLTMLFSWLSCLLFILFILFISHLSYHFLEVPARKFINVKWGKLKAMNNR